MTDRVRNEEMLQRVKEAGNIHHAKNVRKVNCNGHILCGNCLLKHDVRVLCLKKIGVLEIKPRTFIAKAASNK